MSNLKATEGLYERRSRSGALSRRDFLKLSGAGLAGASLLGVTGCGSVFGSGDSGSGDGEKVFNTYVASDIPDLVSTTTTDVASFNLLNNMNEGLYRLDEDDEPVPAMAEGVEVSDDQTSYTFTLRDGIQWSNGDPVTSEDFRYAWLRAMNPDTAGSYASILADYIEGGSEFAAGEGSEDDVAIETPDERTLEVRLVSPTPFFLGLTAFPTYFPLNRAFVEEQGDDFGLGADSLLYNGPYEMTEFNASDRAVMRKRQDYWDADTVDVDRVNVRVIQSSDTALNLYENDELDAVTLTSEQVDQYRDSEEFVTNNFFATYYMPLNHEDEALANENLRRAVLTGIDRKALTDDILNDGSEPARGFVPPQMSGPGDQSFREAAGPFAPEFDPDEARELYQRGVEELGEEPTLELMIGDDDASRDTGTFLQSQLQENLGANVEINAQPLDSALERFGSGDYQMGVISWFADFDDPVNYLDLSLSDSSFNYSNFSSEEYDGLIDSAREEEDPEERMRTFIEAERLLIEGEAALAPLYFFGTAGLEKPRIENAVTHPYGPQPEFKYLRIEE